ncbi:MAG: hypothetical protein WCI64_03120 [Chlorobium sp.]
MKLFPDKEQRKRWMKRALPFLFGIAWTPIILLLVTALFGKPLAALFGWPVTLWISVILTLLCTTLFLRFFSLSGKKRDGEKGVTDK